MMEELMEELFEAIHVAYAIITDTIEAGGGEDYFCDDIRWSDSERRFSIGIFKSDYNPDTDEHRCVEVDSFFFNYDEGLSLTLLEQARYEAENWAEKW